MEKAQPKVAGEVQVPALTRDGRIVYVSVTAYGEAAPGLTGYLERAAKSLAEEYEYWELFGDVLRHKILNELKKAGFNVESVEAAISYRCPVCDASVELNPEAIVYVCPYCGWSGDVFGRKVELLAWRPIPEEDAVRAVITASGRRGRPLEAVLKMIPYWIFPVEATARYKARVVYEEVRGKRRIRREGEASGTVSERTLYPLVARLNAEFYGDREMCGNVLYNYKKRPPAPLQGDLAKRVAGHVLAPEVDKEDAALIIRDRMEDIMVRKAKSHAKRGYPRAIDAYLYEFSCDVKVGEPRLVLAPYWFVTYEWRGSIYSGAVSGVDGDILKVEVPISPYERAFRLAGAWAAAALTGLAAEFVLGAREAGEGVLVLLLIGASVALGLARSAFAEAKVRR